MNIHEHGREFILIFVMHQHTQNLMLLTSPKLLKERAMIFPAFSFIGEFDIAMIKISARAFAFGRLYQSNVQTVIANFSP